MTDAQRHTDLIRERTDVSDNPEVYGDLADAYLSKRLYDKASELYYDMAECDLVRLLLSESKLCRFGNRTDVMRRPMALLFG